MNRAVYQCDVLVIGGGPAGLAAAWCAARSGARVTIVDDNPGPGGQIWRGEQGRHSRSGGGEAAIWFKRVQEAKIELVNGARVFDRPEEGLLLAETFERVLELSYRKLVLATGARERFLPFPGWTLPNVMGAGGLQALVKSGLPIGGERVVIAGTGPLLLAVAAYLRNRGAEVLLIAEQAARSSLAAFGLGLLGSPRKVYQAFKLGRELAGVPYLSGCWPVAANGRQKLSSVTLCRGGQNRQGGQGCRTWDVACDYLACGFHLVPNVELAVFLGCELNEGAVRVDRYQETSVPGIYCAGESTGIGGLELSLIEGQIAGYGAAGEEDRARELFTQRRRLQRFAEMLNRSFALRKELKNLPRPETVICRCEDVKFDEVRTQTSWRAAKLQTRCGMGPCQGRVCGAGVEFLLGWQPESVRPPVFPAKVGSLI